MQIYHNPNRGFHNRFEVNGYWNLFVNTNHPIQNVPKRFLDVELLQHIFFSWPVPVSSSLILSSTTIAIVYLADKMLFIAFYFVAFLWNYIYMYVYQVANDCNLEPVAYECFTRALLLYEQEVVVRKTHK